jgi:hypothetical protein
LCVNSREISEARLQREKDQDEEKKHIKANAVRGMRKLATIEAQEKIPAVAVDHLLALENK